MENIFLKFIFERESMHAHTRVGEGQRAREKESQAGSTLSSQSLTRGSIPETVRSWLEIMTWAEIKSWTLNWQPPKCVWKTFFIHCWVTEENISINTCQWILRLNTERDFLRVHLLKKKISHLNWFMVYKMPWHLVSHWDKVLQSNFIKNAAQISFP